MGRYINFPVTGFMIKAYYCTSNLNLNSVGFPSMMFNLICDPISLLSVS